jgi:hypothetical protein
MTLSQDDIDSIAKAVVESMDDRIVQVVRTKMQLCLGIDCLDNDDLIKARRAIEFAAELHSSSETLKSRMFYGFWGLVAAIVIGFGGTWANHFMSRGGGATPPIH